MKGFQFFFLIFSSALFSQVQDSAALISEVQIDAYRKPTKLLTATKSVSVVSPNFLSQNAPERLLESVNLLPGSKMEERSPGSYRFTIRGSTLRSPFGVRNVKVYLDDFSLTDASGNTYLNILDPEILNSIEIYKGPESGDFGAVTGGTALLKTKNSEEQNFGISAGSFSHYKGKIHFAKELKKHFLQVYTSYETTDSYRDHAALQRKFMFLNDRYRYGKNNLLQALFLFSDLHYETPGGLTLSQMQENPRQSRPKTATLPGAAEQRAGIYNKMIFAGLSNLYNFNENFSHFIAVQGNYNDFRNPFITNFEKRFENNFAIRTHLNFKVNAPNSDYETRLGLEGAAATGIIRNFENNLGMPADAQNFDDIYTKSGFIFLSQKAEFKRKLTIDLAASLNYMNYRWQSIYPIVESGHKKLENSFLPNFGISYLLVKGFTLRGKIGKGNSAPTTEELRSSAQEINPALNPEFGWNKEIGIRKQWGNLLFTELSFFDFRLKNAIVRKENEKAQEYFVNAGETVQRGVEFVVESRKIVFDTRILKNLKFYFAGNFYDFSFKNYLKNGADFSGNQLTGVPSISVQNLINFELLRNLKIDVAHFYTSEIPLNDANSVFAEPSFIGNISASYLLKSRTFNGGLCLSIQNIYNTPYSLGYDTNAFGNRFYNPAADRNYVLAMNFNLN